MEVICKFWEIKIVDKKLVVRLFLYCIVFKKILYEYEEVCIFYIIFDFCFWILLVWFFEFLFGRVMCVEICLFDEL